MEESTGAGYAELCLVNEPKFGKGPQLHWRVRPRGESGTSGYPSPGVWRITVEPGTDIVDEVWVK